VAAVPAHGNARDDDERVATTEINTAIKMKSKRNFEGTLAGWFLLGLWLIAPAAADAHNGPPFPIIENRRVGPCVISLWTHPDVGTGAFFVFVEPIPGGTVPKDLKVQIGVQPESGRLPEVVYSADQEDSRGQLQYKALVDFDRDEFWRVRLLLESSQGRGVEFSRVEATPVGFGKWDLLFFLLPFLAVGFLWFRGMSRHRSRMKKLQAA
jgi:hypothetical protein